MERYSLVVIGAGSGGLAPRRGFESTPSSLLSRTLPYVLASLVGMVPGTLAYAHLGAAAGVAHGDTSGTRRLVQVTVARIATKAIRKETRT